MLDIVNDSKEEEHVKDFFHLYRDRAHTDLSGSKVRYNVKLNGIDLNISRGRRPYLNLSLAGNDSVYNKMHLIG